MVIYPKGMQYVLSYIDVPIYTQDLSYLNLLQGSPNPLATPLSYDTLLAHSKKRPARHKYSNHHESVFAFASAS